MEIRRTTQTSKIPFETETREVPQQPTTSRGVAETTDSFVTCTEQNPLSVLDTSVQQATDKQSPPAQFVTDDSLQKQLQMGLNQANIFQLPKPKLDFGDVPFSILSLSNVTGKSPAELQALFSKYSLDPNNLPKPPNSQVAALFNDPAFDSVLNGFRGEVATSHQNLINQVNSAEAQCNSINQSNVNSDTSVYDNVNTIPFKFMYDACAKQDSYSQSFRWAREGMGQRTADLLSAMYPGEQIAVGSNPEKPGLIQFNGNTLNICPNSFNGKVQFTSNTPVDWPQVNLVPFYVDDEGDGQTNVPTWMVAVHYPTFEYDS
jgi:hypothetical protein